MISGVILEFDKGIGTMKNRPEQERRSARSTSELSIKKEMNRCAGEEKANAVGQTDLSRDGDGKSSNSML
jgi:hypothetical protein